MGYVALNNFLWMRDAVCLERLVLVDAMVLCVVGCWLNGKDDDRRAIFVRH
jgi:hypothetical protein